MINIVKKQKQQQQNKHTGQEPTFISTVCLYHYYYFYFGQDTHLVYIQDLPPFPLVTVINMLLLYASVYQGLPPLQQNQVDRFGNILPKFRQRQGLFPNRPHPLRGRQGQYS